eukprot:14806127-Ditylum_brightwellii.AAC.1
MSYNLIPDGKEGVQFKKLMKGYVTFVVLTFPMLDMKGFFKTPKPWQGLSMCGSMTVIAPLCLTHGGSEESSHYEEEEYKLVLSVWGH